MLEQHSLSEPWSVLVSLVFQYHWLYPAPQTYLLVFPDLHCNPNHVYSKVCPIGFKEGFFQESKVRIVTLFFVPNILGSPQKATHGSALTPMHTFLVNKIRSLLLHFWSFNHYNNIQYINCSSSPCLLCANFWNSCLQQVDYFNKHYMISRLYVTLLNTMKNAILYRIQLMNATKIAIIQMNDHG